MNLTNKRSFVHRANKRRTSESDIPDKFKVMAILKKHFGIITLTDEAIPTPSGHFDYRNPDLFDKQNQAVYELDGEVHGWGDEISVRERDQRKLDDYDKIGMKYYIINSAVTRGYSEDLVVSELKKQGLKL